MKKLLILLTTILIATNLEAQSYIVEKITAENGLMTEATGGSFQDDFGTVWVANGAGFTKFYGDHVEQVKGDYFVFEFGPMQGLRKMNDEYYWQGGRIIDNQIYRHNALNSTTAPWVANSDTSGLGGGIQILDAQGFCWATYRKNKEKNEFVFVRYNSKDTIDIGSILKRLGIEFNSYTHHLTTDAPWNYDLLPFPPSLFIFDNLGRIWIRSKSGGIHTYNVKTCRFISLEIGLQNIAAITIDEDKNYWFTIFPYDDPNPGIYKFDGKDLINYKSTGQTKIITTTDGYIWFADEKGIHKFDGNKFNLICEAPLITDIIGNNKSEIIVRQSLKNNSFIISNLKDSKLHKIIESPSFIFPIVIDHENNLWISTASNGMFKCSRTYFTYYDQTKKISGDVDRSNLNFNRRTKNNLKYYSGYDSGLFVEVDDSLRIVPAEFDGYPIVTPDSVGNLYWFNNYVYNDGNYKLEGICKLDTNLLISQPFNDVLSNFGQDIEYAHNRPLIVNDKIWILTKTSIMVLSHDDIREVQLIDTSIYTMYELQNSNHKDLKSIRLYPKSEEKTKDWKFDVKFFNYHTFEYVNFESLIDSMPGDGSLYSLSNGKNLMTTKEHICVFDKFSADYYKLPLSKIDNKPINFWGNSSIVEVNNIIYHGAYEGGLIRFNTKDSSIIQITMRDGLATNQIYELFVDPDTNYLWLASPLALQRIDINAAEKFSQLKIETWDAASGFHPGYDCEFINDSILVIYSTQGYTEININHMHPESKPKVHFTKVALFSQLVNWNNYACKIDTSFGRQLPQDLVLDYDENNLTFYFQGVSHLSEMSYNYCLKGMDSSFQKTINKSITYTNLDPGNYEFQVQATDSYDSRSETVSIKFQILKPYWKETWFYILVTLCSLGSIFLFVRWRTSKLKQRQKQLESEIENATYEIRQQKEQVEEAHKEITDSINYAERIQRSLMASKKLLNENLNNYFIYFNPKEKVSGDFFWASPLENKKFCLVAADSTGHGVPGAIMSMLNISSLEKAVAEKISESSELLNFTRKKIIETLANDGSAEGGKDGMDAALLIFNNEKTQLEFSLANNPLWIFRNQELIEYKPDKMPVGKHDKQHIPFTKNVIDLQKGDMIYIFTDGYADQFGGEKGKKFKYSSLKELLLSIHSKPTDEQKMILDVTFENWRGRLEQVDDVCVIGVQV